MPNDDDKFDPFSSDKTVILPNPGGSSERNMSNQAAPVGAYGNSQQSEISIQTPNLRLPHLEHLAQAERNCILGSSLAIIGYASQLRQLQNPPELSQLFNDFVIQIKEIGETLRKAGQAEEIIVTSRYLICSFIDEMILNTPWGGSSQWSTKSLLSFFHKESQGGTKFFDILKKIEQQSARYIDLIELVYVCLAYGYLGKFRMQADGVSQISSIQENLYQHIRQIRQHQEMPLSVITEGIETRTSPITQGKALILTGVLSIVVLISAYGIMLLDLNDKSDPISFQAFELKQTIPALIEKKRVVSLKPVQPEPLELLANDLAIGSIDIERTPDGIKFILFGDGLFDSGSAKVINIDLINRVSAAIKQIKGPIKVVGHTDNVPIRTMEFPSNQHLSKKRAESVANLLQKNVGDRAIKAEGMAALQPLFSNSSTNNQAKNRRVEVLLYSN
tara:strand:- start:15190 stop:16530 length:1341 start_codon:yes stop_codon:yes gene_type:complete